MHPALPSWGALWPCADVIWGVCAVPVSAELWRVKTLQTKCVRFLLLRSTLAQFNGLHDTHMCIISQWLGARGRDISTLAPLLGVSAG